MWSNAERSQHYLDLMYRAMQLEGAVLNMELREVGSAGRGLVLDVGLIVSDPVAGYFELRAILRYLGSSSIGPSVSLQPPSYRVNGYPEKTGTIVATNKERETKGYATDSHEDTRTGLCTRAIRRKRGRSQERGSRRWEDPNCSLCHRRISN